MEKKANKVLFLIMAIFFLSCGENALSPIDYIKWVENPKNGLLIEKKIETYQVKLQYQPIDYLVVNELRKEELKKKVLEEGVKKKEGLQYFSFKMGLLTNKPIYSGKQVVQDSVFNYLNYGIQDDFYLVENEDTLACKLFHYENTNGMTPYDSFVLGFETTTDSIYNKTFLFKAKILNIELIKMDITKTALNNIPKVKTI